MMFHPREFFIMWLLLRSILLNLEQDNATQCNATSIVNWIWNSTKWFLKHFQKLIWFSQSIYSHLISIYCSNVLENTIYYKIGMNLQIIPRITGTNLCFQTSFLRNLKVIEIKQKSKGELVSTAQTTNLRIRGWRTKEGIRDEALLIWLAF